MSPRSAVDVLTRAGVTISCMMMGFLIIAFCIGLCVFILWWEPSRDYLWGKREKWTSWIVPSVVISILAPVIWFPGLKKLEIWRANIFSFQLIVHNFVFIPLAFWKGLIRVCYILIFALLGVPRYDVTIFPTDFVSMDASYISFCAHIALNEPLSNPIAFVFARMLLQRGKGLSSSFKRARNRWHLALLLHRNPSLAVQRRTFKREIQVLVHPVAEPVKRTKVVPRSLECVNAEPMKNY